MLNPNPIPTRLCHVIYCHGDKSYPRPVVIGLINIDKISMTCFHESGIYEFRFFPHKIASVVIWWQKDNSELVETCHEHVKKNSRYFTFNVWNWLIQEEWQVTTSSKTSIIDKKSWKKPQTHLKCLELTSSGRTTSTSSKTAGFVGLNLLMISLTAPCHSVISKTRSAEWIMDKVM